MPTDAGPLTPVCSSPDRRLAWAVLARAALTAPTAVERLLATTDVEDAAHQLVDGYETFSVSADLRERAVRDLDRADAVAARLLTREEFEWPAARLAGLGTPGVGGRMPVALWLRGPARLNAFSGHSVAVIGARASTQYGNTVAHDFAGHFAQRGWTVLSGGAFGIDAAAHHAALAQDGATVAVMATGIDRYYPAGNQKLLTRIAEHGLLVSEYPPGETASRDRFLERNRLVAAFLGLRGFSTRRVSHRRWSESVRGNRIECDRCRASRVGRVPRLRILGAEAFSRDYFFRLVLIWVMSSRFVALAASSSSSRSRSSLRSSAVVCSSSAIRRCSESMSSGAPRPESFQTALPSASERRRSSAVIVCAIRVFRACRLTRSARSESRLTIGWPGAVVDAFAAWARIAACRSAWR
ncbi:DNA-processing protein DprA [Nocardia asiatica]|uniref:DNA-processing protein DprA n=1 Tax=Nocardia asiatica TaxID=209252 RepID=UPI00245756EA|nr:DNA-processing protein DprA [Nocardia asiatica]